jgi:uncharacterized protein
MRDLPKTLFVVALVVGGAMLSPATGASPREDFAAFAHGNYVQAARSLAPMARRGNPHAMAMLGFLYENGLGVPQSYDVAADLYIGAAERGDPTGQHLLGLMYDKGHGVDRDVVLAYKWLPGCGRGTRSRARALSAHSRRRRIKDVARPDHGGPAARAGLAAAAVRLEPASPRGSS